MLSKSQAETFAREWIEAWNVHDLPRILAHYTEDFSMSSPFIADIAGEASGTLHGKAAVADYWRKALARMPQLHFELLDVLVSAESLVIHYRNHAGVLAAEVLFLDDSGVARQGVAHYSTTPTPEI